MKFQPAVIDPSNQPVPAGKHWSWGLVLHNTLYIDDSHQIGLVRTDDGFWHVQARKALDGGLDTCYLDLGFHSSRDDAFDVADAFADVPGDVWLEHHADLSDGLMLRVQTRKLVPAEQFHRKHQINVRVSEDERRSLQTLAEQRDTTQSGLIRSLIDDALLEGAPNE